MFLQILTLRFGHIGTEVTIVEFLLSDMAYKTYE